MTDLDRLTSPIGGPLSFSELQRRLSSHVYTLYMNYAFLIKSGVFTVAAFSLYRIWTVGPDASTTAMLLIFWGASFSFSLVTVSTWSRGAAMANARANVGDVAIPIGMAIPEYLFFIAIDPANLKLESTWLMVPWGIWYLFFALHALLACALISNRLSQTNIKRDYDEELQGIAKRHVAWMREDRVGAAISACVAFLIFLGVTRLVKGTPFDVLQSAYSYVIHLAIGLGIIVLGVFLMWKAHVRYQEIECFKPHA